MEYRSRLLGGDHYLELPYRQAVLVVVGNTLCFARSDDGLQGRHISPIHRYISVFAHNDTKVSPIRPSSNPSSPPVLLSVPLL